jgi:hypothetical protein
VSLFTNTLVVSARGDSGFKGAVYNFKYSGAQWSQTQKVVASDGQAGDYFGASNNVWNNILVVGSNGDLSGVLIYHV